MANQDSSQRQTLADMLRVYGHRSGPAMLPDFAGGKSGKPSPPLLLPMSQQEMRARLVAHEMRQAFGTRSR